MSLFWVLRKEYGSAFKNNCQDLLNSANLLYLRGFVDSQLNSTVDKLFLQELEAKLEDMLQEKIPPTDEDFEVR